MTLYLYLENCCAREWTRCKYYVVVEAGRGLVCLVAGGVPCRPGFADETAHALAARFDPNPQRECMPCRAMLVHSPLVRLLRTPNRVRTCSTGDSARYPTRSLPTPYPRPLPLRTSAHRRRTYAPHPRTAQTTPHQTAVQQTRLQAPSPPRPAARRETPTRAGRPAVTCPVVWAALDSGVGTKTASSCSKTCSTCCGRMRSQSTF